MSKTLIEMLPNERRLFELRLKVAQSILSGFFPNQREHECFKNIIKYLENNPEKLDPQREYDFLRLDRRNIFVIDMEQTIHRSITKLEDYNALYYPALQQDFPDFMRTIVVPLLDWFYISQNPDEVRIK